VDTANLIQTVLIYALPGAVRHHGARGRARLRGTPLRRQHRHMMGRITLNPIKHIDPVGTILMPLLLYFATSGAFLFGYAKPVPVNFGNLRNPKRDMVWVALAGPASNFVQAIAWAMLLPAGRHRASTSASSWRWPGRRAGQPGDVGVQPVPAAAAGRRAHPGRPAALEAGACWCRASSPGASSSSWAWSCGHRGHLVAAPADDLGYGAIGLLLTPLTACCADMLLHRHSDLTSPLTRFLTGITTTGTPHLGNYVGAIRPAVRQPAAGVESFYFLADYHALIKCDDPARIQRSTLEIAATWLAAGLDPEQVFFYRQSDIPEIPELTWLLTCVTGKGLLNRAHAYKAAVDKNTAAGTDPDAT
jgi:hypothetical protein